ncbi:MAG: restriction endonuclease subunit S [Ruminococcus sp.]|nr:restriction endonuclease subunit S [Ruminococcus sp.]
MRKMKDSGVEWVGEIPEHWEIIKLKYLIDSPLQYGANESGVEYDENLPRYIRITDITSDNKLKEENKLSLPYETAKSYLLKNNDILFARSGATVGKSFIYKSKYGISAFAGYLIKASIKKNVSPDFVYYYTLGSHYELWKDIIATQSTIQNIGADKYNNLIVALPPVTEQEKISAYLDKKCGQIDKIIDIKKQQIELIKEYKKTLISETVTKGLDKNVKLKDSGVEWLGNIPEHWEIQKIKRLFTLRDEKNYRPLSEVQLLSLYAEIGVFPHGEHKEKGNKAVNADEYKIVKKNDIVVNILLAWMGAIGVSDYEGVTSPAYDVYIPEMSKVVPHYYHYVLRTQEIANECYKYGRGIQAMRWRTYSNEFKQIIVPNPPIKEQEEISAYLDKKCNDIDKIISLKNQQIELLKEYKKSLIYEVVTGKKELN